MVVSSTQIFSGFIPQTPAVSLQPQHAMPSHGVSHVVYQAPHIIEGHTRVHLVFPYINEGGKTAFDWHKLQEGNPSMENCPVKVGI